jgi:hypothetical protein
MNDLNEYSIQYMFSLDNSRRMIYTVNFVVQVLEGKEEDKNLLFLTVSDGINFSRSFLITKKYEFKKYDILKIENMMRTCPKDEKDIIFINRFTVLSNPNKMIGDPTIFPEDKSGREIKFEIKDPNKEIKVEKKKMQIKVQKITFNKTNNNQDSRKENINSQTNIENLNNQIFKSSSKSQKQTNPQIKSESILNNSNIENILNNYQPLKNSNEKQNIVEYKDKNHEDFSIDIDGIFDNLSSNIFERPNSIITSTNQINTPNRNTKNSQETEYRLTQEINQSAILRHIEEINQIEENKKNQDKNTNENVMKIKDKEEMHAKNNNNYELSKEYNNQNPWIIDEEKNFIQNNPYSVSNKNNLIQKIFEKSPNNKSAEKSPGTSYSTGRFERCSQYRPSLRELIPKPSYKLLDELKDGQTDFTIRIRIIKYYKIPQYRTHWFVKVIDEKDITALIKVFREDIDKYKIQFRIYEVFEISKGTVKLDKFYTAELNDYRKIFFTKDTVIKHIKEYTPNIKTIEEDYTFLENLKQSIPGYFSILGYVNLVDSQNQITSKQKEIFSFYIIDPSKLKAHVLVKGKFDTIGQIKVGDIVYISNPSVEKINDGITLKLNKNSILEMNPNCYTAIKLRNSFKFNTRKISIKDLKNISDFNQQKEFYLFRAHICNFNYNNDQYYDGCPTCRKKLKIDIVDYECEKCKLKRKEPKTFLRFNFFIEDFSGKLWVSCYHEMSLLLLDYVYKNLKNKKITPDDYKRFSDSNRAGNYVKELDEIEHQLLFSEFYFKIVANTGKFNNNDKSEGVSQVFSNRLQNKEILHRNNTTIYYNVEDIIMVDKKKERESTIMNIKEILNLK